MFETALPGNQIRQVQKEVQDDPIRYSMKFYIKDSLIGQRESFYKIVD